MLVLILMIFIKTATSFLAIVKNQSIHLKTKFRISLLTVTENNMRRNLKAYLTSFKI